uniref:Uncharacterized protein n=1 Tax=Arundo donax TaxID=35708 RepID=A0A0A8YHQ4_ARUDO
MTHFASLTAQMCILRVRRPG